jgi:hypothetical protein
MTQKFKIAGRRKTTLNSQKSGKTRFAYHGTCDSNLDAILQGGIRPRGDQVSNWPNLPIRSDLAYLANAHEFYYGLAAAGENLRVVVFEIELNQVETARLFPDEDYIAQSIGFSEQNARPYDDAFAEAAATLADYRKSWKRSLKNFGSVAYQGTIPPTAIRRHCVVDFDSRSELLYAIDPVLTVGAFSMMKWFYQDMTKWFFGDLEEHPSATRARTILTELENQQPAAVLQDAFQPQIAFWTEQSQDRSGIDVVNVAQTM